MVRKISLTEEMLLYSLRQAICGNNDIYENAELNVDWAEVMHLASAHAVLPIMYDFVEGVKISTDAPLLKNMARQTVMQSYRLLCLDKYVTELLRREGIRAVTLKGVSTSTRYPVPEYRKSGDVDLLIPEVDDFDRACRLLKEAGFRVCDEQHALHHVEFQTDEKISIEIHKELTDPFDNKKLNDAIGEVGTEYKNHVQTNDYWGFELYEPTDAYHAFYLLIHMLQHFMREGFGVRNLCDWAVFWNSDISEEEKNTYRKLITRTGTDKFSGIITRICVDYLGLPYDKVSFMGNLQFDEDTINEVLVEILDSGDFGKKDDTRMLIVRDSSPVAYIREFHHQMHLNFPKLGKVFIIWPVLWIITLVRFMHNNRTIRHVSMRDILKNAGRRSSVMDKLGLFD